MLDTLAAYHKMRRLPYAPQNQIHRLQQRKLETLLRNHLSPYYRNMLGRSDTCDGGAFFGLPITAPDHFRAAPEHERLSDGVSAQRLIPISTSGSSGRPLTVYLTPREFRLTQLKQLIFMRQHGWQPWWKTVVLWETDGLQPTSWFQALVNLKKKVLDIAAPLAVQAAELQAAAPHLLFSTTDALKTLAAWAAQHNTRLPSVRLLITCGSPLTPPVRELLSHTFQGRAIDLYGANECGYLGFQCPHCGYYYFNEDTHLIEVLDEQNQPASHGRLVLTALDRKVTPLIRYRIGDVITLTPDNHVCPIRFRHFSSVDGRTTDVIILPNGHTITYLHTMKINTIPGLRQFQFVQTAPATCIFRYVANTGFKDADLKHALQRIMPEAIWRYLMLQRESIILPEKNGKYKVIVKG